MTAFFRSDIASRIAELRRMAVRIENWPWWCVRARRRLPPYLRLLADDLEVFARDFRRLERFQQEVMANTLEDDGDRPSSLGTLRTLQPRSR